MSHILPEGFRRVWKEWKIPGMILLSLIIQTVLILTGSRRKYSTRNRLRIVPWLAYLLADWVALVSLSLISNYRDDDPKNPSYIMRAFWAPFLLLHLGGPDTITAYSLEDNETWQRNFVTVCGQVLIAAYISVNAWSGNVLNGLSLPVLVAGIVKCGERVCATMRASSERLRQSMLPRPDPGPNYAGYMGEFSSKRSEGFRVLSAKMIEAPTVGYHAMHGVPSNNFVPDAASLQDAYSFFEIFKCLFADLILSIHDVVNSQSFFQSRTCEEVFRVIEIELGFMFDLLYTKAVLIYSVSGAFCRLITVSCTVSVLLIFLLIDKRAHSRKEVTVSYVLLGGAVVHEIYALVSLLRSDWTMLWLSRHKTGAMYLVYKMISLVSLSKPKRWSNKVAQFNLISFYVEDDKPSKPYRRYINQTVKIYDRCMKNYVFKNIVIPVELKELVFQQLLKKLRSASDQNPAMFKELCGHRGDWILQNEKCYEELGWSVGGEFDQSILLWHIATDLCFYTDSDESLNDPETSYSTRSPSHKEMSKILSEYMLYILVVRPFMLPNGIGQIRYQDTCAEAAEFFKERKSAAGGNREACRALLKVNTEVPPADVKGDRSKSVLFDGCRLAKALQKLEAERKWERGKKWELVSHVWTEMVCYGASQCQRNQHAQQLRRGGELLTHVWLLMAHLGITKQFQISDGHARTKLIVE